MTFTVPNNAELMIFNADIRPEATVGCSTFLKNRQVTCIFQN